MDTARRQLVASLVAGIAKVGARAARPEAVAGSEQFAGAPIPCYADPDRPCFRTKRANARQPLRIGSGPMPANKAQSGGGIIHEVQCETDETETIVRARHRTEPLGYERPAAGGSDLAGMENKRPSDAAGANSPGQYGQQYNQQFYG